MINKRKRHYIFVPVFFFLNILKRRDKLIVDILSCLLKVDFVAFYATNFHFRITYRQLFWKCSILILFASMHHFYNTYNFIRKREEFTWISKIVIENYLLNIYLIFYFQSLYIKEKRILNFSFISNQILPIILIYNIKFS